PFGHSLLSTDELAVQGLDQLGQAIKIVYRTEFVNMRHHGTDSLRFRLKSLEPEERVEPDQPAAGLVQPLHLDFQPTPGVAVETIRDQQHHGPLAEHAP